MNDNAFDALAHEQRRTLLLDILESNPQDVGFESLTGESAPTDAGQRVQRAMYRSHLPKLEDYGYIEWNKDANEVVKGPRFEEIRPLLEWVDDHAENSRTERPIQTMKASETDTELLTTVVERGYFRVPRQTSLLDIADAHDISDKEASQRLRTEIDTVLREHLDRVDATVASEQE